ncbi:membrane protein [Microbacterium nanhaiense]|uniref:Membrane protein n=1 Tax=Microbacterium nanhaiense TaxID=1301026 RepID=A0ABQ2MXW3_9MICO|nr:DUF4383 domain-containing protein [Microbacterium nanhaiense]GGO60471.1 membrane protein [Microbacterium nanhaiense]
MNNTAAPGGYAATLIQKTALAFGIVFLIVGIAGFVPGLTHSAEHLHAAGADSDALLLGVFQVSVLHNIVHLLFAVLGIALAARARASRYYLIVGGIVYLLVWVYGLIAVTNDDLNFLPVNHADNWLHLGLAVVMILLGLFVGRDRRAQGVRRDHGPAVR